MNTELISVIVPIYKVEPYLDRCITSIVQQTYSNLEIILVDDGSPDNCPAICDRWAEKDDRIQVIHKENGGVSSARNAGLRIAQGAFLSFVDPDDYIDPQMMEMMMAEMADESVGFVQCGFQEMPPPRSPWKEVRSRLPMNADWAIDQKLQHINYITGMVWDKLFRRTILENMEFCEVLRFAEDIPFVFQALINAENIMIIPFIGYHYIRRDTSLIGNGYQPYKLQKLQAEQMIATAVAKAYPQLAEKAQYYFLYWVFDQIHEIIQTHSGPKLFSQEYRTCIQLLRNSDRTLFKKYESTKAYILCQFCCHAPSLYPYFYHAWRKVKLKNRG